MLLTKKPAGLAGLNRENASANGLTWAWVPNTVNGLLVPKDLVTGRPGAIATQANRSAYSIGSAGVGWECLSITSDYPTSGSVDSATLLGTAEASLLLVFQKTDTTNRACCGFNTGGGNPGVGSSRFQAHVPYSDGTTYFDFGGSAGSNRISVAGLDYSKPTAIMFAGALAGLRIVQDGVQKASSGTTVTRTQSGAGVPMEFDRLIFSDNDFVLIYGAFIWNRDVPLEECIRLTRNPWQLLQTSPLRLFFGPAAVVADNLMAQACL